MPFNGSGTYSLPAGNPVVTGTTISSSTHNSTQSDIATALSTCLTKDGQTPATANLPMGGFKHTGAVAGSAATDYATVSQLTSGTGSYVGTVGGTADAITLTPAPAITGYAAGQKFSFIASGANTGATTVNVSALGARAITKSGTTALVSGDVPSGALIEIQYDGTQFQLCGVMSIPVLLSGNQTVAGIKAFTGANTHTGIETHTGAETFVTLALSSTLSSTKSTASGYSRVSPNMCRLDSYTAGTALVRDTITLVTGPAGATGLIIDLSPIARASGASGEKSTFINVYSDSGATVLIAQARAAGHEITGTASNTLLVDVSKEVHVKCDSSARVWLVFSDDAGSQGTASYKILGYYD